MNGNFLFMDDFLREQMRTNAIFSTQMTGNNIYSTQMRADDIVICTFSRFCKKWPRHYWEWMGNIIQE